MAKIMTVGELGPSRQEAKGWGIERIINKLKVKQRRVITHIRAEAKENRPLETQDSGR